MVRRRAPRRARRLLLALVAIALVVACTACRGRSIHLVGLHDVVLRYRVGGPSGGFADLLGRVAERLAAAEVAADLGITHAGDLSVRVDDSYADETTALLEWSGGLAIARVDEAAGPGGERPRAESPRPLATDDPPGARRTLQRLPHGMARIRTVAWPPLATLPTERVSADGPRLLVPLEPPLAASLVEVLAATNAASTPPAQAVVVAVVRDRTVVAILRTVDLVHEGTLVVPLGDSIEAYDEAADLARLLRTPALPALSEKARVAHASDWGLAAANLALPFVVSVAWLFFVRRFDRAQPEPLWLVVATFGLGALAVVPAGLLEWGWDALSPYTNPTLLTFGHSLRAFPLALVGFVVTVGLSEEGAKLLATLALAARRREFDEPVDGIVYGSAAALGFAAAENVRYLALGRVEGPLVASRAFTSVPAHLFFGALWGYALGRRLVEPGARVWPLLLAAAALHGLFDTCLSVEGMGGWAFAVESAAAGLFVVNLRLALRHGAIDPGEAGERREASVRGARELFRMGSLRTFAAFAGAMFVFSAALFLLALAGREGRATVPFGLASAVTLGLLGWSARGVASSLPLDAVVDDAGVTFAGARVPYRDVMRIERQTVNGSPRRHERLVIVGAGRRLEIGPASRETIDALAHALAMRLSSVALRS